MVTPTLNRLLIYTVEDSISKLQNIDQERFVKIQKYNKKKNEYIDSMITSMSREILAKWYDKFIEYSNMGFLSCKQYWKCLCDLGYKFAKCEYTYVHAFIFYYFSTQPKMTLDQYMISILVLRNEIPTLLNRDDVLEDILGQLNINFKQREFLITIDFSKEFSNEYLSIFLQLFYW